MKVRRRWYAHILAACSLLTLGSAAPAQAVAPATLSQARSASSQFVIQYAKYVRVANDYTDLCRRLQTALRATNGAIELQGAAKILQDTVNKTADTVPTVFFPLERKLGVLDNAVSSRHPATPYLTAGRHAYTLATVYLAATLAGASHVDSCQSFISAGVRNMVLGRAKLARAFSLLS